MRRLGEGSTRGALAFLRPAHGLVAGADVLAGFVLASPASPGESYSLAVAPLLFASAVLISAAGSVFALVFSQARGAVLPGAGGGAPGLTTPLPEGGAWAYAKALEEGRATVRRSFLAGAALALGGIFAAMGAALTAGRLPVYFAALMFLVSWARAGRGAELAVLGPASAGLSRALSLGMGMGATGEIVFLADRSLLLAPALYFAMGGVVEAVEHAEGEGGRRFLLVGALGALLAVFALAGLAYMRTGLSWIVALTGAAFLVSRAAPAIGSLAPGEVRRFAEGALLAGPFLSASVCFGRWEARGALLAIGVCALGLVVPAARSLRERGRRTPGGALGRAEQAAHRSAARQRHESG
ncbi:MAG: hypothetical protein PVH68_21200 [Armatimonadota bacterium]|jgi:hypothetical protein